eukprot:4273139-Prymnesium_polylepis.1
MWFALWAARAVGRGECGAGLLHVVDLGQELPSLLDFDLVGANIGRLVIEAAEERARGTARRVPLAEPGGRRGEGHYKLEA